MIEGFQPTRWPERIVAGLLQRYPELPGLAGIRWPVLCWRIHDHLRALTAARTPSEKEAAARGLVKAIGEVTPSEGESWLTERVSGNPYPYHDGDPLGDPVRSLLDPAELRCELELEHPSTVALGATAVVILSFLTPTDEAFPAHRLRLRQNVAVEVRAYGFGLEIGVHPRDLLLHRDGLPTSIPLPLTGTQLGPAILVVDLWQDRELVSTLRAHIQVVPASGGAWINESSRTEAVAGGLTSPQADLCIRVIAADDRELRYTLDFENDNLPTEGRISLERDLGVYWRALRERLETVRHKSFSEEELGQIGDLLYQRFWPPELRQALWAVIRRGRASVLIESDVPWIPWELLRPYGENEQPRRFLCEHFDLALWYRSSTGTRPRSCLPVRHVGLVVPDDHGLPAVAEEERMIRRLANERELRLWQVEPADRRNTMTALADLCSPPVHLWHFAGHGNEGKDDADRTPLFLQRDETLRPDNLSGDIEMRLRRDKPVMILNACRVGQGGRGVTGPGGWPWRLAGDCGVGAVLAPRWAVSDPSALAFVKAFYEGLPHESNGRTVLTVANAVRVARELVRQEYPDEPTWLAYTLFAHPNARIYTAAEPTDSRKEP